MPQLRTVFRGGAHTQGRDSCAPATATQKIEQLLSNLSPRITFFLSLAYLSYVAPLVLLCPQPFSRAAHDPSAAGSSPAAHAAFCGPPQTKNAGPQHCAANPLTTKKRRLLAQESTRRHAWLTRSCFGRKNLFIDGPHSLPSFFLSQRKRKRKQKQIQQVRIHRSDSLRSSSRCTRLARRASSAEIYVAIATRFVRDCVEDLDLLTASMERIPKCSWHIKDHCLGVIKASRIFLLLLRFSFLHKIFPTKI